MDKKLNCYKVEVETTNSSNDTFWTGDEDVTFGTGEYFDCEDSICYVITDDPKKIYKKFGKLVIISVEKIGIGYIL